MLFLQSFALQAIGLFSWAACATVQADGGPSAHLNPGFVALDLSASHQLGHLGKRQEEVPTYNAWAGQAYLVNITIGSDSQTVPVLFDTGSDTLWVNPLCAKSSPDYVKAKCNSHPRYSPLSSKTANITGDLMNITYGMGTVLGVYVTDDVRIGGAVARDQAFGLPFDSGNTWDTGILGAQFGKVKGKGGKRNTFLQSLVDQGQVNVASYSLDLRSLNETGSVIFGGIDTKKYKCGLTKVKSNGLNIYLTGIGQTLPNGTSITYSNNLLGIDNATQSALVFLDCGQPTNLLPSGIVAAIAEHYPGAKQSWDKNRPFWTIPCEAPSGSLDFWFQSTKISVPYSDLVVKDFTGTCMLSMDMRPSDGWMPNILGSPFLRGTYMVYDQEKDDIWLGESTDCGSEIVPITKEGGVPRLAGCACDYGTA